MLGDGGCADQTTARAPVADVSDRCRDDARQVDPGVLVKRLVLGGQEGVDDRPWHRLDRHEHTVLDGILGHQPPVPRIHAGHHRRIVVGKLGVVRQSAAELVQHHQRTAGADDGDNHQQQKGRREVSQHRVFNCPISQDVEKHRKDGNPLGDMDKGRMTVSEAACDAPEITARAPPCPRSLSMFRSLLRFFCILLVRSSSRSDHDDRRRRSGIVTTLGFKCDRSVTRP